MKQTIPCAIPISRVDASTSCIDLIDDSCSNPCNEKCYENVVVESCDDLIAKENDELKQEVERLMKDLYRLKSKGIESNVQPSQNNREDMVKKLEKGSTVTCFKCHQEDHKSNKFLNQRRNFQMRRTRRSSPSKVLSSTPSPTGRTKTKAPSMLSRRRAMVRWLFARLGRRKGVGATLFRCPRKSSPT